MRKTSLSPNKANSIDVSNRMIIEVDYQNNNLVEDLKNWESQSVQFEADLVVLEKSTSSTHTPSNLDLHKTLVGCENTLSKLMKSIEATHKKFIKLQKDFDKKLFIPLGTGILSVDSTPHFEGVKANILKIQDRIRESLQKIDGAIEKSQGFSMRLKKTGPLIHKICLNEELSETTKINEKLNAKIELLCQETAQFHLSAKPEPFDALKIQDSMLRLYAAHRKGEQLLERLGLNLKDDASSSSVPLEKSVKSELTPR